MNFGDKSYEYPYGYGYCQCGCGKKTRRLSNGTPLKFRQRHKGRLKAKIEIGTIMKGYEKGWGLCQCGCGQKVRIGWREVDGKIIMTAKKYFQSHFTKTKIFRNLQSAKLKERDYSPFSSYIMSQHGLYFSKKLGREIGYMSSYEKVAFEILDNDPNVINYTVQPFTIGYNYKNTRRAYNPDLLVYYKDGKEVIIEIKPKLLLQKPKNIAKIGALKDFCKKKNYDFEIWHEDILANKARLLLL